MRTPRCSLYMHVSTTDIECFGYKNATEIRRRRYRASILSTSSFASRHVSRFLYAQSMCHLAYAIATGHSLTMYRLRSSSFSSWKRFKSFNTPALASLTSCSDTSSACSSCFHVSGCVEDPTIDLLREPSSPSSSLSDLFSFAPDPRRRCHERRD